MALRAAGLSEPVGRRESLDAIAAAADVSRETARRARNELFSALATSADERVETLARSVAPEKVLDVDQSAAASRALRRVLTMTGRLAWDEVLAAWERAGGKPPYTPLPTDLATMRRWANEMSGFDVRHAPEPQNPASIDTVEPEELDQVSRFLFETLRGQSAGVDRTVLLESAAAAGLKPTSIATALSQHPAVIRVGRGLWALRGRQSTAKATPGFDTQLRKHPRVRPTTFSWSADGTLVLEFSIPRGASPVLAVPKAIANLIEGRQFALDQEGRSAHARVRNAKIWGFAPLLSGVGLSAGQRAKLELDLIGGTARLGSANGREGKQ